MIQSRIAASPIERGQLVAAYPDGRVYPAQGHACVILGIDPAAVSGWAIFAHGKYVASGVARTQGDREYAVRTAREVTLSSEALVVCAEKWTAHGAFGGARTQRGLGTHWGKWLAELERIGHPKRRIVRVYPQTWRAAVLGMGGRGATTEACHRAAILRANTLHLKRHGSTKMSSDEAEAIAISEFGTRAATVAAVLPKRRKR